MNNAKILLLFKPNISLKIQTLAAILSTVAAVALPQLCHLAGAAFGVQTSVGEILLPMHLTGMPKLALLPFMIIELFIYGFVAGLLKNINLNSVLKVLSVQIAGRIIKSIAIIIGFYLFESVIPISLIYTSIVVGIAGIALQLILIPCVLSGINRFR